MPESFSVSSEDQTELKDFLDRLEEKFPGTDPFMIMPILLMIDMKKWKFPEWIHQSLIHEVAEFIENDNALRDMFLKYSENHNPLS